ncbi:diguanylate cyclase [Treponema putidum]|uniref:diguanylate cyclase n=1 Tax=Treponema putidum TaxID=221027 RepID=UPI0011998C3C|nr:diguanylate cyclase [Treponema putidum]TWI78588.1 diguanylate cyclase (GGDEF)-like protein [Treponema putidum]
MEIINNRYKVIGKINNSIPHVQEFLAVDLWSEDAKINLKVISSLDLSNEEFSFFKENFIIISNIDNHFYLKNYGFSSLYLAYPPLPPSNPDEILYIFTTEHIENGIPVLEFVKQCSMEDILKIIVSVCQCLVHASNKGFEYDIFAHDNVMIVKKKGGFQVRIKDIVSAKLENNSSVRFKEAEDYTGTNENIDTVISFIITLLAGKEININSSSSIAKLKSRYKNLNKNDADIFNILYKIVKKQIQHKNKDEKIKIYTIIQDINKGLGRSYPVDVILPLNSITFRPKLVGMQNEINMLSQAKNEISSGKAKKAVFLIKGTQGTGKTRFLKEAEYRLSLERTNIYSNYNFKNSTSENFWDDFLEKVFFDFYFIHDIEEREKIIKSIKQIKDQQLVGNGKKESENIKFKIFNEAKNVFFKTAGQIPAFIILDDLEFADNFMLDTILYLVTEIIETDRLGLIMSYDETVAPVSNKFENFLKILNAHEKCQVFELKYFSEEETIEMLKNILILKYPPISFGSILYKYTSGCPSFIVEMIKEFVNAGTVYRDVIIGLWFFADKLYTDELKNTIPKSIEETLTNQLNAISVTEKKVYSETSLFQNIFKIEYLYKISSLPQKQIDKIIKKLINRGLITIIKSGGMQNYTITNKIMRNILYERLEPKYKMLQHKKIADILKKEADADINELIWHLEESGNKKALLACYFDIIEHNMKTKNIDAVLKIYEKIPSIITGQNVINRFTILLKIFELYNQMGLKDKEAEIKLLLEENLPKIKNTVLLSYYYNLMVRYEYFYLNDTEIFVYIKKLTGLYEKSSSDIINLRLENAKCFYYHIKQQNNDFKESAYKILEITKSNPEYTNYKAEAYTFLGYFYYRKPDKRTALKYFKKSKKLASLSDNIRTQIIAMHNISLIYWETYPDIEKSIAYIKNVISLAKKYGFLSIEVISMINYARMLAQIQNNYEAYEYAKDAEDKIFTYDMEIFKFACIITLMEITQNLYRYKEFCKYKKIYIKALHENKIKYVYEDNFIFYALIARMYQEFGYNNKAIAYLKKSIKIKKYQPYRKIFMVYFMVEALRIIKRDKNDITNLIKIFNSYIDPQKNIELSKRKLTKNLFDIVITMIIKRPDLDFTPLIIQIIKFDIPGLYDFQISAMNYLKTYFNQAEFEKVLQENLHLIKPKNLINITLFINMALADYYYAAGIQSLAIVNYLEIQNKIGIIIKNTPEKYRIKLFNNWELSRPFDIVSDFIKGKPITKEKKYNRNIESRELEEILKLKHINIIKKDKKFKEKLIEDYLKNEGYEHTTSVEIINNFTDDYEQNIACAMRFLALNVIASSYEFLDISNPDEPHFVLNNKNEGGDFQKIFDIITKFGYQDITRIEKILHKPCMIIPVHKRNFGANDYKALGFMIFISEKVINNFSHEGRIFCKKHSNILTMLVERKSFQQASDYDVLTGAYTRKHFEIFFKNIIKKLYNSNSKFSLILYDLDKFKNINDTYGHLVGDIVLKKVTQTILDSLNHGQILGRYGGEEFTVILPDADSQKAFKTAEYFRKKIEKLIFTEFDKAITISLGIATFPEHGKTIQELLTNADQALYRSKNTGRNKSTIWNSSIINTKRDKISHTGIVIVDESSFSEHITATIELYDILKPTVPKNELSKMLLTKIVEFFEADSGAIILRTVRNNTPVFKINAKIGFETYPINEELVHTVAEDGLGIFQVDWDSIANRNSITNMPEWNSVMISPMIKNEKIIGAIYLAAPEKYSKFNLSKFNFFKFLTDIISANI